MEILHVRLQQTEIINKGEKMDKEFQSGDKVKVPFQKPQYNKFKKGVFIKYSEDKTMGYFTHTKSGKTLKRKIELFQEDKE